MDNDIVTCVGGREMMLYFRGIIAPPVPGTAMELWRGHPSPNGWENHPHGHTAHCPSSEEVTGTGPGLFAMRVSLLDSTLSGASDLTPVSMNTATGNLCTFAGRQSSLPTTLAVAGYRPQGCQGQELMHGIPSAGGEGPGGT